MKGRFFLIGNPLFLFISFLSFIRCSDSSARLGMEIVPDSIDRKNIVAAFYDIESVSVLLNMKGKSHLCKLTYRKNFPLATDTLILTGENEFRSLRFRTSYFLRRETIHTVLDQKIIHPCSNW